MRNFNIPRLVEGRHTSPGTIIVGAGILAVTSALLACGSGSTKDVPKASPSVVPNIEVTHSGSQATHSNLPGQGPTLTFDSLGGGSNTILVYPAPGNSPIDLISNGTFSAGQTAPVVCEDEGRTITSNPSVGEAYKRSNIWYEIRSGGHQYFATAVYADVHGGPVRHC